MRLRIRPSEIICKLQTEGVVVTASHVASLSTELGFGRVLRNPALGLVFNSGEAKAIIKIFKLQHDLRLLQRKVVHGCIDASCKDCDNV